MKKTVLNRYLLITLCINLMFVLCCACDSSSIISSSISGKDNTTNFSANSINEILPITKEDFEVVYRDVTLNQDTPLTELSKKLGIQIGIENDNNILSFRNTVKEESYGWYIVYYPNQSETEIVIEYILNETNKSGRIIRLNLKKIPTRRGILVGDSIAKVESLYESTIPDELGRTHIYAMDSNDFGIIVDKETRLVRSIFLNFSYYEAMDEMGHNPGD